MTRSRIGEKIHCVVREAIDWICGFVFRIVILPGYFTSTIGKTEFSREQYLGIAGFVAVNLCLVLWPASWLFKISLFVLEGIWLLVASLLENIDDPRSAVVLLDPTIRGMKNDGTDQELTPTFHKNPKRE